MMLGLERPDLLRTSLFIGGSWLETPESFEIINPATNAAIARVTSGGAAQAEAAITAAAAAADEWRQRTGAERGSVLRQWHDLILANVDDLARIMTTEQGKPLSEARGEVDYAASFLEFYAEEARRVRGEILTPHLADRRLLVQKMPVGVVAAITPWNFPLAMITRKAGPALAAGCTMVLKPSELTPLSALALARLAEEAGLPPGVFNVVAGDAAAIGTVMTDDPRVRKFTFTGSTATGKMLAARCMATVKRVSLELGGNAPFIVFDDADIDAAVEGAITSKFRNSGQTCVCPNRFLIQNGVYEAFAKRLAHRVRQLIAEPGTSNTSTQGPLIDRRAIAKVDEHVRDALERGARTLTGGAPIDGIGNFYAPTVLSDVSPNALLCREETFGPVAGLLRFADEAEAISLANATNAGLAAYLYTNDLSRSWRVSEALQYGMVGLNTGLISTTVAPFGGVKESGIGREGARQGIDEYLDTKFTCVALRELSPNASTGLVR